MPALLECSIDVLQSGGRMLISLWDLKSVALLSPAAGDNPAENSRLNLIMSVRAQETCEEGS